MTIGVEIIQDEFREIADPNAELRLLSDELEFAEGVCWLPDRGYVIVSDFKNNRIMRWNEEEGMRIFREPSDAANGNTQDLEGRVLSCLTRGRTVVRLEHDGSLVPIASRYEGGKLTSPNDVVVKKDGTIWFTDPDYGFLHPDFGHGEKPEQTHNRVYMLNEDSDELISVSEDFDKPNGIAFSPDESVLYVGDSGRTHGAFRNHQIIKFEVTEGNAVLNPTVFTVIEHGVPDGFRCDVNGNLYVTTEQGVQVFDPDGRTLGKIHTPEIAANCSFGMSDRQRLFIGATSGLWCIDLNTQGAA